VKLAPRALEEGGRPNRRGRTGKKDVMFPYLSAS
jgi:hypothetical protein